jgi:enoyl-CoA hydratase/carnithine racemase
MTTTKEKAPRAPETAAITFDPILGYSRTGDLVVMTMKYRPYNLVGPKLIGELRKGFAKAEAEKARAIVLKSGIRHFSAGADMDQFTARTEGRTAESKPAETPKNDNDNLRPVVEFLRLMELLPIPIIASVHGVCLGGGLELALACDYVVAAQSAKIGSVESTLGLHPLMGATQRQVQRIGMARAKEMSMLGRRYDPDTLAKWGLINLSVPDDALEATTMTLAQEFANGPTVSYAATKRLAYVAASGGVFEADKAMAEIQEPIWESEDLRTGLSSFMSNGPGLAKFKGV